MRSPIALLVLLIASGLHGQQTPPPDMQLDAATRSAIIEATAHALETEYLDEAMGRQLAAALRTARNAGSFDPIKSALALVPPVNRILAVAGDKHLRFGYSAKATPPPSSEDASVAQEKERIAYSKRGFGISGAQRLDGNVGLLSMTAFVDPAYAGRAVASAMELLSPTDALIVDLRGSAGGAPEMVAYLMSFFFDGEPRKIVTLVGRGNEVRHQFWTWSYVSAPRYVGKEVYILTDGDTWSAAEGFAAHMKAQKRALIVGEKTRGGAHLGDWENVHPNFAVFVPRLRALDSITGTNWEGSGVAPDIAVRAADALRTTHRRILEQLRERAGDDDMREELDAAIARLKPQSP